MLRSPVISEPIALNFLPRIVTAQMELRSTQAKSKLRIYNNMLKRSYDIQ